MTNYTVIEFYHLKLFTNKLIPSNFNDIHHSSFIIIFNMHNAHHGQHSSMWMMILHKIFISINIQWFNNKLLYFSSKKLMWCWSNACFVLCVQLFSHYYYFSFVTWLEFSRTSRHDCFNIVKLTTNYRLGLLNVKNTFFLHSVE